MRVVKGLEDLKELVGEEIGVSGWVLIDQDRINAFAHATDDHQWIHTDVEKAKASPLGNTIAHGFLTVSLIPRFMNDIWRIENLKMGLNYSLSKVRFLSMVPSGSQLRMRAKLISLNEIQSLGESARGVQLTIKTTFEREGDDKPVCIAESRSRLFF